MANYSRAELDELNVTLSRPAMVEATTNKSKPRQFVTVLSGAGLDELVRQKHLTQEQKDLIVGRLTPETFRGATGEPVYAVVFERGEKGGLQPTRACCGFHTGKYVDNNGTRHDPVYFKKTLNLTCANPLVQNIEDGYGCLELNGLRPPTRSSAEKFMGSMQALDLALNASPRNVGVDAMLARGPSGQAQYAEGAPSTPIISDGGIRIL